MSIQEELFGIRPYRVKAPSWFCAAKRQYLEI